MAIFKYENTPAILFMRWCIWFFQAALLLALSHAVKIAHAAPEFPLRLTIAA